MKKSFKADVEEQLAGLRWTFVRVPFDPKLAWPERIGMRVKGTVNGFEFRSSLFPSAEKGYLLLVNRKMQKGGKATRGHRVTIEIEPDLDVRATNAPPELGKLFRQDRDLKTWFEKLNPSMRRYIMDQVREPKSPEARLRRAEQMAEMMMLVMEAEIELPPVLQVAFRRHPLASRGWEAMTPIQRRSQLLSIFYCQGPEARNKRVERACAEAVRVAQKKAGLPPADRRPADRWKDDLER
jgi:uncharacterized protein YdeI (YjbR/CyaY-like superfamily)